MISTGDLSSLCHALEAQGWTVEKLDGSHRRAKPPNPDMPIVHMKRSNSHRDWQNLLHALRASGFREDEVGKRNGNGNRSAPAFERCPHCRMLTFSTVSGGCTRVPCPSNNGPSVVLPAHHVREQPVPVLPPSNSSLDAAFVRLREAKELWDLAHAELNRAREREEEANERRREAERALAAIHDDLTAARKEFDSKLGA